MLALIDHIYRYLRTHLKVHMDWVVRHRMRIGVFLLVLFFARHKDMTFSIDLDDVAPRVVESGHFYSPSDTEAATNVSQLKGRKPKAEPVERPLKKAEKTRSAKQKKQLAYVARFSGVAQTEMKKYGIPASITLAQGLLESNVGESTLATKNNNHFGIKCFSRRCRAGHCSNFSDDHHKDFFRKYNSAWESYRAHSKLLQRKRYRPLYKLGKRDYKRWAHGLKKAGYATDKRYAEKLIALIEELDLDQYDQ